MSTGRLNRVTRAAVNGQAGEGLLRADNARENKAPSGKNEVILQINEEKLTQQHSDPSGLASRVELPRRASSAAPSPYTWSGSFRTRAQSALPLGELWDPNFSSLVIDEEYVDPYGDPPSVMPALPPLPVEQTLVAELKVAHSARFVPAISGTTLHFCVDNGASHGSDLAPAGQVVSIRVTSKGRGYTSPPVVSIIGDGVGATAEILSFGMFRGMVRSIRMVSFGSGYNPETTIVVISGGGGSGAEGRATVEPLSGADYFTDRTLFWKLPIHNDRSTTSTPFNADPQYCTVITKSGSGSSETHGLHDTVILTNNYLSAFVIGGFLGNDVVISGYSAASGWSYDLGYWAAVVNVPTFDHWAAAHSPKQAIRLDPVTRQPTHRWWLPETGSGSSIHLRIGTSGEELSTPTSEPRYPGKFDDDELYPNPAADTMVAGLVWPECRGDIFFATEAVPITRHLYWRLAEAPRFVSKYHYLEDSPYGPSYGHPELWWVASMRSLIEQPAEPPPGWGHLCTIPGGSRIGTFISQPMVGQLVVISTDLNTLNSDYAFCDGYLFPIGTRLPYMLRGKGGMVGGWDGLVAV